MFTPLFCEPGTPYQKVLLSRMNLRTSCVVWLSIRSASRNTSSNLNMEMMEWSLIPREANIFAAPCSLSMTTTASVTFKDFKTLIMCSCNLFHSFSKYFAKIKKKIEIKFVLLSAPSVPLCRAPQPSPGCWCQSSPCLQ